MALIALLLGPLILLVSKVFGLVIRNNGIEVQNNWSKLTQQLQEALTGQTIVKIFRIESAIAKSYINKNDELFSTQLKEGSLSGLLQAISIGISYCSQILVFAIGCFFVASGQLTIGDLFAFIVLSQSLITPFSDIGNLWANLQRSLAAVTRIHDFLNITKDEVSIGKIDQIPVNIEFRNVSFTYEGGNKALDHISFKVLAGQKVAIIGDSGSGKSTLMKLLLGLYQPTEGEIWVQQDNGASSKLNGLNLYASYVPQEHFLFDDTIYQNILYGEMSASEEQIYQAANMASAHHFITDLSDQYDFQVGERGSRLSGGQKQRINLARAFVGNRSILVFDEATSALDVSTEEKVLEQLNQLNENQTLIMITHRLSTAIDCDMIIFMEKGKVLAAGTHHELLSTNDKYKRLYEHYIKSKTTNEAV